MARIALCLYLMLSTAVAGPAFCCCRSELSPARPDHPAKQDPPRPSCCQHHANGGQRDSTADSGSEKRKHGPTDCPSCPCQQGGGRQAILMSLDSEANRQVQSRYALPGLPEVAAALLTIAGPSSDQGMGLAAHGVISPFLTAQDILCALHILRC